MDLDRLMRLKGIVEASERASMLVGGPGLVASYPRIRQEVADAITSDLANELGRLFPAELATAGKPHGAQAEEVKTLLSQMAGWLGGMIESAILERRIQAEAQAKAKQTGFR